MTKSLMELAPHYETKIWGGDRLQKLRNIDQEKIGETWEVSIHHDGPSKFNGEDLDQILTPEELPYLIKYIDTSDNLSVQVHPDDDYAQKVEMSSGKTECWLILDAEEGAGIYLGFKAGVDQTVFDYQARNGGDLTEFLEFYPVSRGDFFFVPAGAVHAIGKGVFLCEVQQSSGITYRVWDWNRVDDDGNPRQLHIEKAMNVLRFDEDFNDPHHFKVQRDLLKHEGAFHLLTHSQFKVELFNMTPTQTLDVGSSKECRYTSIVLLDGELQVDDIQLKTYNCLLLKKNESCKITANKKSSFILVS